MRIIVTGGAGFVGSSIAVHLRETMADATVVVLDNLHRRGSELTLARLQRAGVDFIHGDVRIAADLAELGQFDALIECSAEPSVLAGRGGGFRYLTDTNLNGAIVCAEACVRHNAAMIFLSTSRVYPIEPLTTCGLTETDDRFDFANQQSTPGLSQFGVSENFPMEGPRSLYGATKYAAEVMLRDVAEAFQIPIIINRCGVIAGPWQFGKIDQGIAAFWVKAHMRKLPLQYIGFGGSGKQVRDFLHIDDLCDLIAVQLKSPGTYSGAPLNAGGGRENSVSLRQLTEICVEATGQRVEITAEQETRYADIPVFVTDSRRMEALASWAPQRSVNDIVGDTVKWLNEYPEAME